ncbi:MAG: DUF4861 family protein [Bacteroidetes bacterium]|nr:DUF4861 family protein [Bacteroidota bacterium]
MDKVISVFFFVIIALSLLLVPVSADSCAESVVVHVKNELNLDRQNEIISLKWDKLQKHFNTDVYENILVQDLQTSDTLITQWIDEDQDGIPEELIFSSGLKAKETKIFAVKAGNQKRTMSQYVTFAQLMIPREDVAWENDRIAFRIYGPPFAKDVSNGIDVWTKRVRYPIIEKWYKGDEAPDSIRVSYHEDHGEGADFFSVGKTLGAGSCALYKDDTLYQPGVFTDHKIITKGPLRAIFEVKYKPVKINNIEISEVKRITLDAGSNLSKIDVIYKSDSKSIPVHFTAGLVKRKGVTGYSDKKNNWISLWGLTDGKEINGSLGTGAVSAERVFNKTMEDSVHILLLGNIKTNVPVTYYSGAGWTRSGDFNTIEDWNKYLNEFAKRLKSPLKITIKK